MQSQRIRSLVSATRDHKAVVRNVEIVSAVIAALEPAESGGPIRWLANPNPPLPLPSGPFGARSGWISGVRVYPSTVPPSSRVGFGA